MKYKLNASAKLLIAHQKAFQQTWKNWESMGISNCGWQMHVCVPCLQNAPVKLLIMSFFLRILKPTIIQKKTAPQQQPEQ